MNNLEKVVVRIPPSPTGYFHIGRARTALFNYLFARKNKGKIVFRIEDTDKERSKKEYEEDIIESLEWLGIDYDDFYRQSERGEIYKKYIEKMLDNNSAYVAEDEVIRFKNPNRKIKFDDLVRGEIEFDTSDLEDFIVAKSINEPLYHLAVVVDDHESGVTHVIRGDDGISNTPRQILLQEAVGAVRPRYAHVPMILAPDRSKLSARQGATSIRDFRDKGYLPQAMINYLALLGWNPGTEQEIFTKEELIEQFSLEKIQKSGAIFDEKKLQWVNREHLKRLPAEVQKERQISALREELYIKKRPTLDVSSICWNDISKENTKKYLEKVKELVGDDDAIMKYAEKVGKGNVLWPLRYALSGLEKSPDPFTLMAALGKDESISRIEKAIQLL
ncbi:MAG: glutamate--tRNA ligase [Candidatus Zambryskibacteria bacterium]|nr:glutamate--tRNA ligase [Candidatus Zambryskibacteria bacterium]